MSENNGNGRVRVCLVDPERLVRDLFEALIRGEPDLELVAACESTPQAMAIAQQGRVDLFLIDGRLNGFSGLRGLLSPPPVVVMAASASGEEAVRWQAAGVAGILLTSSPVDLLLKCIRKVAAGEVWFSQEQLKVILRQIPSRNGHGTNGSGKSLTGRESRVLDLVLDGLTNKEIANSLNLTETAVKATLQGLFHKWGVRSRSQLVRVAIEGHSEAAALSR